MTKYISNQNDEDTLRAFTAQDLDAHIAEISERMVFADEVKFATSQTTRWNAIRRFYRHIGREIFRLRLMSAPASLSQPKLSFFSFFFATVAEQVILGFVSRFFSGQHLGVRVRSGSV